MKTINFEVLIRKEIGKNKIKALKNKGFIPGVIYGGKDAPQP
ncbi:50S ribosomal protein L25, partial [Candidatus Margulisiibacteriota bacterium]